MVKNKKIRKIKTEYQPEKIILFGSYAYGKPTEDSDIDLFIVKKTSKNRIDRYVDVSKLIYGLHNGISIQPIVRTPKEVSERLAMGDDFIQEVIERGEVLYAQ